MSSTPAAHYAAGRASVEPSPSPTLTPTPTPVPSGSDPVPVGVGGTWKLAFRDEFDATAVDASKWSVGWFGTGITKAVNSAENACYDPQQVSMSGGVLNLGLVAKSLSCAGVTHPYAGSLINSNGKYQFAYGAFEARIWVAGSGSIANWPAFWAVGQNWPGDGEIDVIEGLSGQACWHFHYTGGGPGGCATGSFSGGWHTFSADWEPGAITYYYDGARVGQITTGVAASPMYLIFDNTTGSWGGPTLVPATMKVDYVRVWHH